MGRDRDRDEQDVDGPDVDGPDVEGPDAGRPDGERDDATDGLRESLGRQGAPLRRPRLPTAASEGADVGFSVQDTGVGRLLLAVGPDEALVASTFVTGDAEVERALRRLAGAVSPRVVEAPSRTSAVVDQLEEYLAGDRRHFDVPVDLVLATPFQRAVLTELGRTGYGSRTTYGSLAREVGRPAASRAVGAALGANPVCVVLPCHRVVAGSGALTGYAGGVEVKRRLLALEGGAGALVSDQVC